MDHPDLSVSNFMEKSIGLQWVNYMISFVHSGKQNCLEFWAFWLQEDTAIIGL